MKSVVSLVTSIALMTSILVSNFGVSVKADSKSIDQGTRVYIDPKINYQTIEGWGTSLAWWANVLGNWKDQSKIDEVTKKLFSQSEGLGLNAVRYNIGAGGTLTPSLGKQPRIGELSAISRSVGLECRQRTKVNTSEIKRTWSGFL
jgi:O-Glycosyl hydrolase family 30